MIRKLYSVGSEGKSTYETLISIAKQRNNFHMVIKMDEASEGQLALVTGLVRVTTELIKKSAYESDYAAGYSVA